MAGVNLPKSELEAKSPALLELAVACSIRKRILTRWASF